MSEEVQLDAGMRRTVTMLLFILRHPGGLDPKLKEALRREIDRLMTAPARKR